MAIVESFKMRWESGDFQRSTRVNRDGLFRIKYPPGVSEQLGCEVEAVAKTKDEAEKIFRTRLEEYRTVCTETRKVIVYHVEMSAHIRREGRRVLSEDGVSFSRGVAVAIWAEVCEEKKITSGKMANYIYETLDSSLPVSIRHGGRFNDRVRGGDRPEECLMLWTPEREAFFCRVAEMMESLVLKLHDMTDDGSDAFAEIADSWSGSFLPAPESDKKSRDSK